MITAKDYAWIETAKKLLPESDHPRYRVAALLVKGGRVIARATNRIHPVRSFLRRVCSFECGRHAEANLLWKLDKKATRGATLYVCGDIATSGATITARPCAVCRWFAGHMGIARVVFTSDGTGSLGEIG